MTQEFSADGDNWTMVSSTGKGGREFKFTIGQETDSITLDGRPIKVCLQYHLTSQQYYNGDRLCSYNFETSGVGEQGNKHICFRETKS